MNNHGLSSVRSSIIGMAASTLVFTAMARKRSRLYWLAVSTEPFLIDQKPNGYFLHRLGERFGDFIGSGLMDSWHLTVDVAGESALDLGRNWLTRCGSFCCSLVSRADLVLWDYDWLFRLRGTGYFLVDLCIFGLTAGRSGVCSRPISLLSAD